MWPPSVTVSMASVLTRTCGSLLISSLLLSCRRYYKETSGLMLDVGGYMKALEVPAMICPMPSSGLLEKREHFTYKKPFMCRVSSRTLPPLWSWLSHCLGHHTVSHMCVILSSQPRPTSWSSLPACSSLTPGCLLPGPIIPQASCVPSGLIPELTLWVTETSAARPLEFTLTVANQLALPRLLLTTPLLTCAQVGKVGRWVD